MSRLKSNLWKYFLFELSQRRHFIPILSIFFLTLPNTMANQIGVYSGIGFIVSFFLEIPSGYVADMFGHKKTLVLSKILMIISMTAFVFASRFYSFVIGSVFLSLSIAFSSGTKSAFIHNTLVSLKEEHNYTKIMSRIGANISIFSMVLIIALPFFSDISIRLPLIINLGFDILGLFAVLSLVDPISKYQVELSLKPLKKLLKELFTTGFYPLSLFLGVVGGVMIANSAYRYVYVESLGLPIILVGFIMGLSRLVWFVLARNINWLEKIKFHNLLFFEIFIFSGVFLAIALLNNPYVVSVFFIIIVGYFWGRKQIMDGFILKNFVKDKNLKATLLSLQSQIQFIIQAIFAFVIGFIMDYSFKLGFAVISATYFVFLSIIFFFLYKRISYYK